MLKMYKHFYMQALCGGSVTLYGTEALVAGSVWWFCHRLWDRGTSCRLCVVVLSVFVGQRHLSQALRGCSVSIYGTEALVAVNLSSSGCGHVGSLFIKKDRKKVGSGQCTRPLFKPDVFLMSPTWSKWHCSQLCFCNFQMLMLLLLRFFLLFFFGGGPNYTIK